MGCGCGRDTRDPAQLPVEFSVAPGVTRGGGAAWLDEVTGVGPPRGQVSLQTYRGRPRSQETPLPAGTNWTITGAVSAGAFIPASWPPHLCGRACRACGLPSQQPEC